MLASPARPGLHSAQSVLAMLPPRSGNVLTLTKRSGNIARTFCASWESVQPGRKLGYGPILDNLTPLHTFKKIYKTTAPSLPSRGCLFIHGLRVAYFSDASLAL